MSWFCGVPELAYLSVRGVDVLDVVDARERKHLVLQPVERGTHRLGGLAVGIDDDVQDSVQNRQRAEAQHRRVGIQPAGCVGCLIQRVVPDGEHVAGADEEHQLSRLQGRFLLYVPEGFQCDGQYVAEALPLRPLVRLHRLDCQAVQAQLAGQLHELALGCVCSPGDGRPRNGYRRVRGPDDTVRGPLSESAVQAPAASGSPTTSPTGSG